MLNFIKQKIVNLRQVFLKLPKIHRKLILGLFVVCLIVVMLPTGKPQNLSEITLPTLVDPEYVKVPLSVIMHEDIPDYEWVVSSGDTLGEGVFDV